MNTEDIYGALSFIGQMAAEQNKSQKRIADALEDMAEQFDVLNAKLQKIVHEIERASK